MICKVCQSENRSPNYVCYRCINTSPKLLLPWRFKLLEVRVIRDELSDMVNAALEEGINESMGLTEKSGDGIPSTLGLQLKRVQTIKEVRRNNKIKQNIHLVETQIDRKSEKILRLKQLLNENEKESCTDMESLHTCIDGWKSKVDTIVSFVNKQQKKKIHQLNKWFDHDEGDPLDDFQLFNQPVFSLQMLKENANNENTIASLRISLQYIEMVTKILYIPIPYSFDASYGYDIDVDYCVGLLVYCCHTVCDKLGLFPFSRSPYRNNNIKLWLRDYDINEILYYISRGERLPTKHGRGQSEEDVESCIWTVAMIQELVEDLCSDSNSNGISRSTRDTVLLSPIASLKDTPDRPSGHGSRDQRLEYLQTHRPLQGTNPNNAASGRPTGNKPAKPDTHPTAKNTKKHSNTTTSTAKDRWFVVG